MSYHKDHRIEQAERGQEGVEIWAKHLESHTGILTTSINEPGYSIGTKGFPDLVWNVYAHEVKRVELLTKTKVKRTDEAQLGLSNLKVNSYAWECLKRYCDKNHLILKLVIVLTQNKREPLFIGFTREQIDEIEDECRSRRPSAKPEIDPKTGETYYPHKKGEYEGWVFGIDNWDVLHRGQLLNKREDFIKFFDKLTAPIKEIAK